MSRTLSKEIFAKKIEMKKKERELETNLYKTSHILYGTPERWLPTLTKKLERNNRNQMIIKIQSYKEKSFEQPTKLVPSLKVKKSLS